MSDFAHDLYYENIDLKLDKQKLVKECDEARVQLAKANARLEEVKTNLEAAIEFAGDTDDDATIYLKTTLLTALRAAQGEG